MSSSENIVLDLYLVNTDLLLGDYQPTAFGVSSHDSGDRSEKNRLTVYYNEG